MKLIAIKIKDLRSYGGENLIELNKGFTSFIGRNDIGKSTVLDALDIFFENGKPELSDLYINSEGRQIEISCIFDKLPESLIIDSGASTSIQEEYLSNSDGFLEVKKIWKCTDKTIAKKPEISIVANYPNLEQVKCLHSLKQNELKALGEKMGLTVLDSKLNHLWRKEIWKNIDDLSFEEIELKISDFDTKATKVYSKIEESMPLFFVFRSDREMTDSDSEAKDPMQLAVAEAQSLYETEIEEIRNKIQKNVEDVASSALEKLNEIDSNLANELKPVLRSTPKWKFDYGIEDGDGVLLNKRGSGSRRLVLLNFFRAQAEKKSTEVSKGIIYAIEEPETSQHPNNQKLIINALKDLSKDVNRQVIITTHSPELLRELKDEYFEGIRFIQKDSDESTEVISGKDGLLLSAGALGVLEKKMFNSAEKIVLVEGKKDCLFLEHTADMMVASGEITKNLAGSLVEVLPVGGCDGIKNWTELNKHKELGLETYVFLDSDRKDADDPSTKNEELVASLEGDSSVAGSYATKKREIENYISEEISGTAFGDYDDAKAMINHATGVSKRKIIDEFWVKMKSEDIDEEIKEIVKKIVK